MNGVKSASIVRALGYTHGVSYHYSISSYSLPIEE